MLEWFLKGYRKHNALPIHFADFGLNEEHREWVEKNFDAVIDLSNQKYKSWFYKPSAMRQCNSDYVCWLDTDLEIRGDMSPVFDHVKPNKLSMGYDKPWTRRSGETWFNSGVVAFCGSPRILTKWANECRNNPRRGDQETLHYMLPSALDQVIYIEALPNKYNVLRIQLDDKDTVKDIRAMHWTGELGKRQIKKFMK